MIVAKQWSGRKVRMPGIIHGIPMEDYHSADICIEPSISSSGLRTIFNQSLKHYYCTSPFNPNRIKTKESPSMLLGRAAHHLLFGEEAFRKVYAVRPDTLGGEKWNGNRTACKLWLQARQEAGLSVITAAQLDNIKGMAASLKEEPLVRAGILNGNIEHSWFWKDKETGIWLKIRPDASPNDSLDFCDLKTTTDIRWQALQYTIRDYGYYQQAGLVAEGCKAILNQPMNSFSFVFVESEPPHCVAIVTLDGTDIDRGIKANRIALRKFAKALESGKWPGPNDGSMDARYIRLRDYDAQRIDEQIKAGIGGEN